VGASLLPAEWTAIWHAQSGLCAVCLHALRNRYDSSPQVGARVGALDHCHVVESQLKKQGVDPATALRRSIRGLLCGFPCNRLLVRHWTTERLANAARYVADMPAQKVLTHG